MTKASKTRQALHKGHYFSRWIYRRKRGVQDFLKLFIIVVDVIDILW